ncbi:MAG: hypothetical protein GOV00_03850 [Candidatus Altiarchaeota archaeon]|nr:hypothetical protein [Candidatus Altiarchaeota archaeon]
MMKKQIYMPTEVYAPQSENYSGDFNPDGAFKDIEKKIREELGLESY